MFSHTAFRMGPMKQWQTYTLRWGMAAVLACMVIKLGDPWWQKFRPWDLVLFEMTVGVITSIMVLRVRSSLFRLPRFRLSRFRLPRGSEAWIYLAVILSIGFYACEQAVHRNSRAERILKMSPERLSVFGRHFIVGYRDVKRIRRLVEAGAVGGIFITQRNVRNSTAAEIRQTISGFQQIRRNKGLPPLVIAADQEGGLVSRLSPPLTRLPTLGAVAAGALDPDDLDNRIIQYAAVQAGELADLGVNLNLSPVVDLKTARRGMPLQDKTRIHDRAVSNDPELTARVARVYCKVMEEYGVVPTLKHFPGLGRVAEETHFTTGHLDQSVDVLNSKDWVPFREVLAHTRAAMMLGHVKLDRVDPLVPVSFSRPVIQGIIRKKWQHDGVLITDDLNMGPAYNGPWQIGGAAVNALNAGVDLLLISYDGEQVFKVIDAVLKAAARGDLDMKMLADGRRRLDTLFIPDQVRHDMGTYDSRVND